MKINNSNFNKPDKFTINPRQLVEGLYTEFNYQKRDDTSSKYKILVLDVYPANGYVWGLKLDTMTTGEVVKLFREVSPGLKKVASLLKSATTGDREELMEDIGDMIHPVPGGEVFKLPVPTNGKQTYSLVKKLQLVPHYRKFIMKQMKLVRVRDFDPVALL